MSIIANGITEYLFATEIPHPPKLRRRKTPGQFQLPVGDHPGLIPTIGINKTLQQPGAPLDEHALYFQSMKRNRKLMDQRTVIGHLIILYHPLLLVPQKVEHYRSHLSIKKPQRRRKDQLLIDDQPDGVGSGPQPRVEGRVVEQGRAGADEDRRLGGAPFVDEPVGELVADKGSAHRPRNKAIHTLRPLEDYIRPVKCIESKKSLVHGDALSLQHTHHHLHPRCTQLLY